MTIVLIDTSVWIHFFRSKNSDHISDQLEELIDENQAAMCGIVEMELLHGLRPSEQKKVMSLLSALPFLDTTRETYQIAGKLLHSLREKGVTVPATDSLIAAIAIQSNCPLMTLDANFNHFQVKIVK